MYILINNRIATNTSGSHCLKNVERVEYYMIFFREIVKTHQKRVNSLNHTFIERAVGVVAPASTTLPACVRAGNRHFEHMM